MADAEESKLQKVKNKINRIQDKIHARVEDICEELQDTMHGVSPKANRFISHLTVPKSGNIRKSESNETIYTKEKESGNVAKSASLENLNKVSTIEENWKNLKLASKIKLIKHLIKGTSKSGSVESLDNPLHFSKSELSLIGNVLYDNKQIQRRPSCGSSVFSSEESLLDAVSVHEQDDVGTILDISGDSKIFENVPEKNIENEETKIPHIEIDDENKKLEPHHYVHGYYAHLAYPYEILERLGHKFPKLKEKGDRVQKYFQRSTRLADVNRRLKCQIWSSVVTIVLVEAKGLTAMDQDTGSSDPYCKFRLGNEKYKSKVIWRSLDPCWLEQFDLHLYDDQEQILELTIWDRDKQSKDDFLGRCVIDLSMLEREKTHSIRKELEDSCGEVFLLLTISGTTSAETITDLTNYQDNPRERKNIEDRFAWYRLDIFNDTGSSGVGWLCVKVFGAKGLAAADLGGKSDPFCVLELINARLQTHTEYKTLQPNWMKIFTFTVKDINSVLEITVYDEDHDHKVEFLGKLAIPLLNIKNGDKRWYSLKDKKMRARAKGNCPQILLEMTVIWNPIKGSIRTLNPQENKYMHTEIKFKRQVFLRNVIRLKSIILWFIEIGKILQASFEWDSRIQSFVALLGWIFVCYYFEPWMGPIALLGLFARNWLIYWLTGSTSRLQQPIDDEELLAEEDEDDPEQDKEEKKSLKERLQAIQEVTQSVQNSIGYIASLGEEVKNLFNFTVPYLSYLAVLLLLAASLVLFLIPVRYLLMLWGINKFTRKILRPHTIPNNEVLDLLSRVPDDEELLDYRELKTHNTSEPRKDARKKHKAS